MKRYNAFIGLLVIFCVGVVIAQSDLSGEYKSDQHKQNDLRSLSAGIDAAATKANALPTSLAEIKPDSPLEGQLSDYSYKATDYNRYQLCTSFTHARKAPGGYRTKNDYYTDTLYHGSGHQCFTYTAYGVSKPVVSGGSFSYINGSWVGSDATFANIQSSGRKLSERWCSAPYATNAQGSAVAVSSIPAGSSVTLTIFTPRHSLNVQAVSPCVQLVHESQVLNQG